LIDGLSLLAKNAWSAFVGKIPQLSVKSPLPSGLARADLNGNGIVDLADFSVLAYWYERPDPPASVDLNGDGKVDLADFSIIAHYYDLASR